MVHPPQTRIMQNGSGWYWEVVTHNREVIGRGIADTHAQARTDAKKAAPAEPRLARDLPNHVLPRPLLGPHHVAVPPAPESHTNALGHQPQEPLIVLVQGALH